MNRRVVFLVVAVVSLLVGLGEVVLWARADWIHVAAWGDGSKATGYTLSVVSGAVTLQMFDKQEVVLLGGPNGAGIMMWEPMGKAVAVCGVHFEQWEVRAARNDGRLLPHVYGYNRTVWVSPVWVVALAAVMPVMAVRPLRAELARRRGRTRGVRCRKCKYDLTGNVSGVCPECGEAVAGK